MYLWGKERVLISTFGDVASSLLYILLSSFFVPLTFPSLTPTSSSSSTIVFFLLELPSTSLPLLKVIAWQVSFCAYSGWLGSFPKGLAIEKEACWAICVSRIWLWVAICSSLEDIFLNCSSFCLLMAICWFTNCSIRFSRLGLGWGWLKGCCFVGNPGGFWGLVFGLI